MSRRRRFTPEQKAMTIRRNLAGKEPVSDLADELGLQPSETQLWVKQVLDPAERAFQVEGRRMAPNPLARRVAALEEVLQQKQAVISELLQQIARQLVAQSTGPQ